jgi:hypothetical protein
MPYLRPTIPARAENTVSSWSRLCRRSDMAAPTRNRRCGPTWTVSHFWMLRLKRKGTIHPRDLFSLLVVKTQGNRVREHLGHLLNVLAGRCGRSPPLARPEFRRSPTQANRPRNGNPTLVRRVLRAREAPPPTGARKSEGGTGGRQRRVPRYHGFASRFIRAREAPPPTGSRK